MKKKHICTFIFSVFFLGIILSQEQTDSTLLKKERHSLFIGTDLISPMTTLWDKSSGYEFNINMRVYKKIHAVGEIGYQKDNYSKVNWDVDVDGMYYKVGANWSFNEADYNTDDFFYTGLRFAFTSYNQNIKAYPISSRDESGNLLVTQSTEGIGEDTLSASWLEFVVGARKKLWETNFFLDTSFRPKVLVSSKAQNGYESIIIPGFGKNINNFNVWLNISINYRIPLSKL